MYNNITCSLCDILLEKHHQCFVVCYYADFASKEVGMEFSNFPKVPLLILLYFVSALVTLLQEKLCDAVVHYEVPHS